VIDPRRAPGGSTSSTRGRGRPSRVLRPVLESGSFWVQASRGAGTRRRGNDTQTLQHPSGPRLSSRPPSASVLCLHRRHRKLVPPEHTFFRQNSRRWCSSLGRVATSRPRQSMGASVIGHAVLAYEPPTRVVISWDVSPQWQIEADPRRPARSRCARVRGPEPDPVEVSTATWSVTGRVGSSRATPSGAPTGGRWACAGSLAPDPLNLRGPGATRSSTSPTGTPGQAGATRRHAYFLHAGTRELLLIPGRSVSGIRAMPPELRFVGDGVTRAPSGVTGGQARRVRHAGVAGDVRVGATGRLRALVAAAYTPRRVFLEVEPPRRLVLHVAPSRGAGCEATTVAYLVEPGGAPGTRITLRHSVSLTGGVLEYLHWLGDKLRTARRAARGAPHRLNGFLIVSTDVDDYLPLQRVRAAAPTRCFHRVQPMNARLGLTQ